MTVYLLPLAWLPSPEGREVNAEVWLRAHFIFLVKWALSAMWQTHVPSSTLIFEEKVTERGQKSAKERDTVLYIRWTQLVSQEYSEAARWSLTYSPWLPGQARHNQTPDPLRCKTCCSSGYSLVERLVIYEDRFWRDFYFHWSLTK